MDLTTMESLVNIHVQCLEGVEFEELQMVFLECLVGAKFVNYQKGSEFVERLV